MAIVKDGEAAAVHWHNQTEDICKLVVIHDPLFLEFIAGENQNDAICEMAVAKNGLALEHVFCQTASICEIAIMQNPMALSYVQDQISYLEKLAIMGDGNILEIIDSEHSFPEMYNIAIIRSRGNAIQFIPKNNQTSELRRLALICDSKNIQYLDLPTENELKILAMTNWEKIEENYPNSSPDVKILAQIQKRLIFAHINVTDNKNIGGSEVHHNTKSISEPNIWGNIDFEKEQNGIIGFIYGLGFGIGISIVILRQILLDFPHS